MSFHLPAVMMSPTGSCEVVVSAGASDGSVLGSVLGLLGFFLDAFAAPLAYSAGKITLLFIWFSFPGSSSFMEERAFNLFAFNAPSCVTCKNTSN